MEARLCKHADTVKEEVDIRAIQDELVQERVITFDEHNIIRSLKVGEKHSYLRRVIIRKSRDVFLPFCEVLKDKSYQSVANLLLFEGHPFEPTSTSGTMLCSSFKCVS